MNRLRTVCGTRLLAGLFLVSAAPLIVPSTAWAVCIASSVQADGWLAHVTRGDTPLDPLQEEEAALLRQRILQAVADVLALQGAVTVQSSAPTGVQKRGLASIAGFQRTTVPTPLRQVDCRTEGPATDFVSLIRHLSAARPQGP